MVADRIKTDYPSLADKIMSGEASAITIGELSGELGVLFATQNSPYSQVATVAMMEKYGKKKSRFMKNTRIGAQMDDFAKHYSKQQRKQMAQFIQEATEMEQNAIEARIEYRKTMLENGTLTPEQKQELEATLEEEKKDLENIREILKQNGYELDTDGDIIEVEEEPKKEEDIYAAVLLAAEKDLERYKSEGSSTVDKTAVAKKYDVDAEDMVDSVGGKTITQKEVNLVNKAIDDILLKISQGKEVDLSSEGAIDAVIKELSASLAASGLLKKGDQSAEVLFKQGKEGLKAELKKKAAKRNSAVQATTKRLEEVFTPEGAAAIKSAIEETARESSSDGKRKTELSVMDVLKKIEKTQDGSLQIKSTDGSVKASVKDGSRSVGRNDGSQPVGGKSPLSDVQLEALQQFMQVTRAATPPPKGKKVGAKKEKELIQDAAKTARERKMQQAMLALLGDETVETTGTETPAKPSTQDILAQLTQREADYVTASVRDLLELKELNAETARLNRDKVKGPKSYVASVKKESSARIAVAALEKEILIEESRTDTTEMEKKTTVDSLKIDLKKAKDDLLRQEKSTTLSGPVRDITSFVRSGFKNDTVSTLMSGEGSGNGKIAIIESRLNTEFTETKPKNGRKKKRK